LLSVFITSILEFLTSWEIEKFFQRIWWDYSGWRFNFQGRVSLVTSLEFGIGSILVVNWIHLFICGVFDKYIQLEISQCLSLILLTITVVDLFFTVLLLL